MEPPSRLEQEFHQAMLEIYWLAKSECNYNATRFLQMVANDGGLKTARKLLASVNRSDGFTALWECGRLDLAVEALVIQPKYQALFTEAESVIAKGRLREYGYDLPKS